METRFGANEVNPSRFYRFGEFELDSLEETLRNEATKLDINHRMFQVLLLLVERKGEVVSKEEFFEKVWVGSFVEDNNLTVTITALRKILGDSAKDARYIENLPRKGYRFIASVEAIHENSKTKPAEPAGHEEREIGDPGGARVISRRSLRMGAVMAVIAVVSVIVVMGSRGIWPFASHSARNPAAANVRSIAILPFEVGDADTDYLADGLTDGIIGSLSRLPNLRVIDRNSAFHYKNKPLDAARAGRELNVRAVVSGQVERQGDIVVVNVAVIDAVSNSQTWHQQFKRPAGDLLAIQQDIAEAIAKNVLSGSGEMERPRMAKRPTNDPEAYDLYLKGRYYWNKRANADILRSVEMFRAAIDLDPTFAMAYIGLANAYTLGSFTGRGISNDERIALSRGAVRRALEIDDTIGEAYASVAINECYYDWNFAGAERDYRKAVELSPNDATAHHWYAEFLSMQGRFDESYAEYEKALSLDPLSLPIRTDMAFSRYYARDYDKAIELLNLARQIDPEYRLTYNFLMFTYREKGLFLDAANVYEQEVNAQYGPNERSGKIYNIIMRHVAEQQNAGPNLTAERYWRVELKYADDPGPFYKAVAYSKLGETDRAFEYLEKAYNARYSGLVWLKVTPEFDGVRSDPRYQDLLRRVGLSK